MHVRTGTQVAFGRHSRKEQSTNSHMCLWLKLPFLKPIISLKGSHNNNALIADTLFIYLFILIKMLGFCKDIWKNKVWPLKCYGFLVPISKSVRENLFVISFRSHIGNMNMNWNVSDAVKILALKSWFHVRTNVLRWFPYNCEKWISSVHKENDRINTAFHKLNIPVRTSFLDSLTPWFWCFNSVNTSTLWRLSQQFYTQELSLKNDKCPGAGEDGSGARSPCLFCDLPSSLHPHVAPNH